MGRWGIRVGGEDCLWVWGIRRVGRVRCGVASWGLFCSVRGWWFWEGVCLTIDYLPRIRRPETRDGRRVWISMLMLGVGRGNGI